MVSQRQPRQYDAGFLAWLRRRPCCLCGKYPPSEAAHIRMGSPRYGKLPAGMQEKPDDKWAVPLCVEHHRIGPLAQHGMSEEKFWYINSVDPFALAMKLYAEYGGNGGKPGPRSKIKPRLPKEQRKKIQSRGFR